MASQNNKINEEQYLDLINRYKENYNEEYKSKRIKYIFLDILPKLNIVNNKERVNWRQSPNNIIYFIYKNIEGYVEIINYDSNTRKLTIKYNNKEFKIKTGDFIKCNLGKILGNYTSEFRIEIGQTIKDSKRDLTIIDREYRPSYKSNGKLKHNYKYYKYHCNKDNYEDWIEESCLLKQKHGCTLCSNQKVVVGINSIVDTTSWMIPYFQGGYDEAKLYMARSNKKIYPRCPDCGRVKDKKISVNNIYSNHGISCSCSDKIPYPEKFTFSVLEQLGVSCKTQLSKTTFEWCNKYRYDFYFELNSEKYIIETHGIQHYEDAWDKLEKTQENDRLKKELALNNGIKEENYIVVDCRKSNLDFIKDSVLNNKQLNKLFNLSFINWLKAEEFALVNKVKEACDYWESGIHNVIQIGSIMKLSYVTITNYLHKGHELDWCNSYDTKKILSERSRRNKLIDGKLLKSVEVFKDGISFGIFKSIAELERKSEKLFGVKFSNSCISRVCLGERKSHKGYSFKYVEERSI